MAKPWHVAERVNNSLPSIQRLEQRKLLHEVMTQIATDYQARHGAVVRTESGPSGLMREHIECGERVDLFASADMGHPLKL